MNARDSEVETARIGSGAEKEGALTAAAGRSKGRVLMLTQYLGIGGLERMILNLSLGLKRLGSWEPSVFVYDASYRESMASMHEVFEKYGVAVENFRKDSGFSWRAVERIAGFVRKNKVHTIHSHDLGALIYGALAKLRLLGRVRLVHTQHSFVHLAKNRRYRMYEKLFTRFADELVVVSEDTLRRYADLGVDASRIRVIQNGVDFAETPTLDRDVRVSRRNALIKTVATGREGLARLRDAYWILYLARVHGGKGQLEAVDLWNALSETDRASAALVFVGPETEPGALDALHAKMRMARDSERVVWVGATQTPREWIEAADCFLSSSTFEGMPLAPFEAVGSGLPVILSDIAGHEGLRGIAELYRLTDSNQGANLVSRLMKESQGQYARFARTLWERSQPVRDRLSTHAMSAAYSRSYEPR